MAKIKKNSKLILFAVLLIAAFLRLWRLSEVPVSLFGDELDVGYHAYSILQTGKDYSGNPWPLHFQSLAEWRTPLYIYSVIPTVAVYGISPLGVRLPAALFGIFGVLGLYLLAKELIKDEKTALVSAAVLAFSPWHIQYSRAAFEVTQLLAFILFGLYFFFKSFKKGKLLWLSAVLITITPMIYSTAKFFAPVLLVSLFVLWRKEIFKISKRYLFWALAALLIVGLPTAYATLYSGGGQRFEYIGIFTDPTIEHEVGYARVRDARVRGEKGLGISPSPIDRAFHNKFVFWGENISRNLLESFSTNFLFIKGDLNLRHSIDGMGQFYKVEFAALIAGLVMFFAYFKDKKVKLLIALWILFGVVPSALTRDGGTHATRLILILPPIVLIISYGLVNIVKLFSKKYKILAIGAYITLFVGCFIFYQHEYWVHNPWDSERWWHSGFKETFQSIKKHEKEYDNIILSMANEPVWIFFAGWYEYPPEKWHRGYPFDDMYLDGFGEHSYIDKFHFAQVNKDDGGVYALREYIDTKTLYMAVASEVGENLIREPQRTPEGLLLIDSIAYPSGEPAYYLFTKIP